MLNEALLKGLLPELAASLSERLEELLGSAGRDILVTALQLHLEKHGEELLAPVLEIERLKRKKLLTPAEVETVYGIKRRTLEDWRHKKVGPEYEKPGGTVKYRATTLDAFCRSSRVLTSESPALRAAS